MSETGSRISIAAAREIFSRHIESRHLRKTPERYAIMEHALGMKGHFSSDSLYSSLEREGFHVSRSTVYTTLELLCECGLVRQHLLSARRAGYEVALSNHCHLLCTRCRKVTELDAAEIARAVGNLDTSGFSPSYFSLTIYGLCPECAAKDSAN